MLFLLIMCFSGYKERMCELIDRHFSTIYNDYLSLYADRLIDFSSTALEMERVRLYFYNVYLFPILSPSGLLTSMRVYCKYTFQGVACEEERIQLDC